MERLWALNPITSLEFCKDGSMIFVGSGSYVYVYDETGVQLGPKVHVFAGTIHGLHLDASMALVYGQKMLNVYTNVPQTRNEYIDSTTEMMTPKYPSPLRFCDWIHQARLVDDQTRLVIGFAHNFIQVFDLTTTTNTP